MTVKVHKKVELDQIFMQNKNEIKELLPRCNSWSAMRCGRATARAEHPDSPMLLSAACEKDVPQRIMQPQIFMQTEQKLNKIITDEIKMLKRRELRQSHCKCQATRIPDAVTCSV
jgi:hypothetical protein